MFVKKWLLAAAAVLGVGLTTPATSDAFHFRTRGYYFAPAFSYGYYPSVSYGYWPSYSYSYYPSSYVTPVYSYSVPYAYSAPVYSSYYYPSASYYYPTWSYRSYYPAYYWGW